MKVEQKKRAARSIQIDSENDSKLIGVIKNGYTLNSSGCYIRIHLHIHRTCFRNVEGCNEGPKIFKTIKKALHNNRSPYHFTTYIRSKLEYNQHVRTRASKFEKARPHSAKFCSCASESVSKTLDIFKDQRNFDYVVLMYEYIYSKCSTEIKSSNTITQ